MDPSKNRDVLQQAEALCLPQDLDKGVQLASLDVPVEEPAHHPQLGPRGDQPQGGYQCQGSVFQDKLLKDYKDMLNPLVPRVQKI